MSDGGATLGASLEAPVAPPFTAGWLLARTFSIWGRSVVPVTLVCALPYAPIAVVWALPALGISVDALGANAFERMAIGYSMTMVVQAVATGVVACAVVEQLRGGRAGAGVLLGALARRGPALLPLALAETLILVVAFGAFLVPGIWARLVLLVAAPALAVEGCGTADALRRSRELTRGRLGTLLGAVFPLGVLAKLVDMGGTALVGALEARGTWLGWTIGHAAVVFSIGPTAVASAVAYHALCTAKEAGDGGELARVFE